jgi:cytochrome c oxidase subunit 3
MASMPGPPVIWCSLISSSSVFDPGGRHDGPAPRRGTRSEMGLLGMWLFLLSLAALFIPTLILYLILRSQSGQWPPAGMPPLPSALWLSTGLLVATSAAMHYGLWSVRHDGIVSLRRAMILAASLAVGFLACQAYCWAEFFQHSFPASQWRYAGFFYFFTTVHALHIIGGLVPLWLIMRNSLRNRYNRFRFSGVRYCTMYWHFLDAVWVVMFAVMIWPSQA